jgi:Skp family chaperone for outer membrane proteins
VEDILAIVFLFGGGTIAAMAFSPIGRALADRIRGKAANADGLSGELADQREQTASEIANLQQQVGELAERLDFAERMLSKQKDAERLAPPR